MKVYLDNASTTPLDKEVLAEMQPYLTDKFGNPSSLFYSIGLESAKAVEDSREKVAGLLGAQKDEIIFTSSGTESTNLAIIGTARANKGKHIVTSEIEHPSVLEACRYLEKHDYKVTYLKPDKEGFINPADVGKAINIETVLVSIEHANIEIGTIQNIEEIGKICKAKNVLFHVNVSETAGKIPVNVQELNCDLLSISAHKLYGPKGVGALYVKKGTKLEPLIYGGGHEFGKRSGTENVAGIVGLAKALELAILSLSSEMERKKKLRDKLIDSVLKIEESWLNGSKEKRLPGNANFGFKYIEGEAIVLALDSKGIAASTGSACSSKNLKASHVLLGLGQKQEYTHGSARFTIGKQNTEQDIDYVLEEFPKVIDELRKMSPYGKGKEEY